jgi:hypothetical protein
MRKFLWVIVAIMGMGFAAPKASASPVFTCIGPCASVPRGSASDTAITFIAFGHTIDFTGLSLTPGNHYGWAIINDVITITDLTSSSLVLAPVHLSFSASNEQGLINLFGTSAPAPTPEPGSIVLMLLGAGVAMAVLTRKTIRLAA